MRTWSDEQNELLAKIWPTGESLKKHRIALGDRPYTSIVSHAHKVLKLGARPKSARGVPGYAWDMIKAELAKSTGTAPDLIKRTGLSMAPVCKYLRDANPGPNSEIHICDWLKRSTGGEPVAVYALGPGKNAPKPKPFTAAEKARMAKARKRARTNPFFVAAGFVPAPSGVPGRIYQQSMSNDELEAA